MREIKYNRRSFLNELLKMQQGGQILPLSPGQGGGLDLGGFQVLSRPTTSPIQARPASTDLTPYSRGLALLQTNDALDIRRAAVLSREKDSIRDYNSQIIKSTLTGLSQSIDPKTGLRVTDPNQAELYDELVAAQEQAQAQIASLMGNGNVAVDPSAIMQAMSPVNKIKNSSRYKRYLETNQIEMALWADWDKNDANEFSNGKAYAEKIDLVRRYGEGEPGIDIKDILDQSKLKINSKELYDNMTEWAQGVVKGDVETIKKFSDDIPYVIETWTTVKEDDPEYYKKQAEAIFDTNTQFQADADRRGVDKNEYINSIILPMVEAERRKLGTPGAKLTDIDDQLPDTLKDVTPEGGEGFRSRADVQDETLEEIEARRDAQIDVAQAKEDIKRSTGLPAGETPNTSVVGNWEIPNNVITVLKDSDIAPEAASVLLSEYRDKIEAGWKDNDIVEWIKAEFPGMTVDQYDNVKSALEQSWLTAVPVRSALEDISLEEYEFEPREGVETPSSTAEFISRTESDGRSNILHGEQSPGVDTDKGESSAVGEYQFIWTLHGNDIKEVTGLEPKEELTAQERNRLLRNPVIKRYYKDNPEELKYIQAFLESPEIQKEYFDHINTTRYQPEVERLLETAPTLTNEELTYLRHYIGSEKGVEKFLKTGRLVTKDGDMTNGIFEVATVFSNANNVDLIGRLKEHLNNNNIQYSRTEQAVESGSDAEKILKDFLSGGGTGTAPNLPTTQPLPQDTGAAGTTQDTQVPLTEEVIEQNAQRQIRRLEDEKLAIENANIFGDDVSQQIGSIDSQIEEIKSEESRIKKAIQNQKEKEEEYDELINKIENIDYQKEVKLNEIKGKRKMSVVKASGNDGVDVYRILAPQVSRPSPGMKRDVLLEGTIEEVREYLRSFNLED